VLVHRKLARDWQTVQLGAQSVLVLIGHVQRRDQMLKAVIDSILRICVRYCVCRFFRMVRSSELVVLELHILWVPLLLLIL